MVFLSHVDFSREARFMSATTIDCLDHYAQRTFAFTFQPFAICKLRAFVPDTANGLKVQTIILTQLPFGNSLFLPNISKFKVLRASNVTKYHMRHLDRYLYRDQTVVGSKMKFVTNELGSGSDTERRYSREIISRCVPGSTGRFVVQAKKRVCRDDIQRYVGIRTGV